MLVLNNKALGVQMDRKKKTRLDFANQMKTSSENLIMQINNEVSPLWNENRLNMKHNNDMTPNPN